MAQVATHVEQSTRRTKTRTRMAALLALLVEMRGLCTAHIFLWRTNDNASTTRADLERLWCDGAVTRVRAQSVFSAPVRKELNISGRSWFWIPVSKETQAND